MHHPSDRRSSTDKLSGLWIHERAGKRNKNDLKQRQNSKLWWNAVLQKCMCNLAPREAAVPWPFRREMLKLRGEFGSRAMQTDRKATFAGATRMT